MALLVCVLVVLMGVTARERERLSAVERAVASVLRPVEELARSVVGGVQSVASAVTEFRRLRQENALLKNDLVRLQYLEERQRLLSDENNRLRAMLGLKQSLAYTTEAATVIARSPDNWSSYLVVDKGGRDGIAVDMPVVTGVAAMDGQGPVVGSVVGRVASVSDHTAVVRLLTDASSGIGAMLDGKKDAGVILGQGSSASALVMEFFSRDAAVAPGDTVITSGLGGVFPPGLPIGVVQSVSQQDFDLVRTAVVKPNVDLNKIDFVLIITSGHTRIVSTAPDTGTTPPPR